jgi:ferredoxin-NADP reductase
MFANDGSAKTAKRTHLGIDHVMQLLLSLLAIALIGVSTGQFLLAGKDSLRIGQRLRTRQRHRLKKLRSAARVARLTSELKIASQTSQGSPWRVAEVIRVVDESADTKSFYLADPYQQDFPDFYPGQYLMVRPALAGSYQATRCYSLSVAPNPKLWRITVKKVSRDVPARPDRKTGALSAWLHDNIRDGDCLLVGGPGGQFYLPPQNTEPLVLLAAGVGITPMSSILQHSIRTTPDRPVSLYYQVKDLAHWPLGDEVHAFADRSKNCRVITYVSRGNPQSMATGRSVPGDFRSGRICGSEVAREVNQPKSHYFLCGPDAWMQKMKSQLSESTVPESHIHWESFGNEPSDPSNIQASGTAFSVRFQKSQIQRHWGNQDQSLWELARENDVVLPSGCLSGVCGSCRVKILKGNVRYDRKVPLSLGKDECLACVAKPTEDLVLDA